MGEIVGAITALEYMKEGNFVESYGKKMSKAATKIKLLLVIVIQCKQ